MSRRHKNIQRQRRQRENSQEHTYRRKGIKRKSNILIRGNNKMTPQEALDILNQAASTFQGTRQNHIDIQTAVSVLQSTILQTAPVTTELSPVEEDSKSAEGEIVETPSTDSAQSDVVPEKPAEPTTPADATNTQE